MSMEQVVLPATTSTTDTKTATTITTGVSNGIRRGVTGLACFVFFVGFVATGVPGAVVGSRPLLAAAQAPSRIISLVPALTEMLFAMGAGPAVVAVSSYDEDPPEVRALPRVGALVDPDVERILSLTPDLVLTYGSQTDLRAQLARAGIRTFDYRHAGLPDVLRTMRALGEAVGHGPEAGRLAEAIEGRIDRVRRAVAGRPRPRGLLVCGREAGALRNSYASGGRGFLPDMLVAAGGDTACADVDRESVQVSSEQILARAPDVILELRSSMTPQGDVAREVAAWSRLRSVPAVRDHRVHVLGGKTLVVPGPRVAESIERMAAVLHPGALK
ncbi:MAG: ABC transporter substrate-binding protein [Vicinamibacterales bacterium]